MKKFLLPVLAVFCFSSCSIIGVHFKIHNPKRAGDYPKLTEALKLLAQPSHYRDCYDVTHYQLNVKIDPNTKYISGRVAIIGKAVTDFDTLQIDLNAQLKLNSVMLGDAKLPTFRKAGAIFVALHRAKGEAFRLDVEYEGKPQEARRPPWAGGMVWKKDAWDNLWCGVTCQSEGASLWWPCKDMVSDEADSTAINISIPSSLTNLMAVSNGRLRSTDEKDGWKTYHWFVTNPINNYNVTFYIGNFKLLADTYDSKVTGKKLDLNHYVLEQNYEKAKTHFQQLKKHLAFYEEMFGAYPWYADGFKLVESPYEGMEHQSAIAYGNGYNDNQWGFDYIILHETAHEWWGNEVTATDLADGWIHEGFATYCEALYVERTNGKQAYENYLRQNRLFIINRRPVAHPYGLRYFDYHDEDMYMKGAWILHSLRTAIGNDSVFFDILKTFATKGSPRNASTQDFLKLINSKTGKDWKWFFDQYLYNRFVPEYEYLFTSGGFYGRWNPKTTQPDFQMQPETEGVTWIDKRKSATEISTGQVGGVASLSGDAHFLFKPVRNKKLKRLYKKQVEREKKAVHT